MPGVNPLIIRKIESLKVDEETKKTLKDLLMIEFMNQQKNNKNFFDQYDDVLSRNLGD